VDHQRDNSVFSGSMRDDDAVSVGVRDLHCYFVILDGSKLIEQSKVYQHSQSVWFRQLLFSGFLLALEYDAFDFSCKNAG